MPDEKATMTKSDWACGIAAAMIGGALLAFQFFILLRGEHTDIVMGAGGINCYQPEGCKAISADPTICKNIKGTTICGLPGGRIFPND